LLLDEPTSALDLQRQLEVLQQIKQQTISRNLVTLVALHDLNLAAKFADQIIVMEQGKVIAQGDTETIFHSNIIEQVYGIELELMHSKNGNMVVSAEL
jgi:iron complex transport system ATP-binding protein